VEQVTAAPLLPGGVQEPRDWKIPIGSNRGEIGILLKSMLLLPTCKLGCFATEFSLITSIVSAGGKSVSEDLLPMPVQQISVEEWQWEEFQKLHKGDGKVSLDAEVLPGALLVLRIFREVGAKVRLSVVFSTPERLDAWRLPLAAADYRN
jgi:hypothetical protein